MPQVDLLAFLLVTVEKELGCAIKQAGCPAVVANFFGRVFADRILAHLFEPFGVVLESVGNPCACFLCFLEVEIGIILFAQRLAAGSTARSNGWLL